MKWILTLCFLLVAALLFAQSALKGTVIDETDKPVPGASVFLNNTSVGTTANNDGNFELFIPAGRFELIVSSIGFQTYNQAIPSSDRATSLVIRLKIKAPELETIIIEPFEKNGWEKWGKWFTENFIGTSEYSQDCRIKNPEVLRFRNSKRTHDLTVIATAPLIIENKALGYRVTYQMENFHYDFSTRYLLYAGYPFFQNMEGSDRKQRMWERNRSDVYYGSMMHFMRLLYRNTFLKEGFEVRQLQKKPNDEKQRIRMVYKNSVRDNGNGRIVSTINGDSSAYYNHIMSQDDFINIIGKSILPGDSIAYAVDSTIAGMAFEDYLLIIYKNKNVPVEFMRMFPKGSNAMMSEITLINNKPIEVLSNGSYFNPQDLLSTGYWAWWEKAATMLPFDYQPPK